CVLQGGGAFDREPLTDRIVLCDARTGRVIRRWSDSGRPSNGFEELAFSNDGRLLASSDGNVVHLWEVLTGKELRTFHGHRGEIRSLAFSANGRRLASASNDSTVVIWDLVPARDAKAKGIAGWWDDLASEDARRAYAAVWRLAESAEEAVPFLRRHLRPIAEPDAKRIRRLIDDLDSSDFAAREKASAELAKLGELVAPALRAALADKPSLEVARRAEELLQKLEGPVRAPNTLRALRAVEVLEYIATSEAQQILKALAQGAPAARLTEEAKAALARRAKQNAGE
ncbi:MAG TPA: hypothetical protein VKI65_11800, partial [Gemmataceae bacterium]|nr:hypothetical protein [Gemmataceae bacterium]